MTAFTLAHMDQIVTTNCLDVRIGKKRERITRLTEHLTVGFRRVDANRYWPNTYSMKLI